MQELKRFKNYKKRMLARLQIKNPIHQDFYRAMVAMEYELKENLKDKKRLASMRLRVYA